MKIERKNAEEALKNLSSDCGAGCFGDEIETRSLIEQLEKLWEPALSQEQWEGEIELLLENAMRLSAALGSWMRTDNPSSMRAANAGFRAILDSITDDILGKVKKPYAAKT